MRNQEKLYMGDIIRPKIKLTIREDVIVKIVENACELTIDEIRSKSRERNRVIARSLLGCLLRKKTGTTFNRVGSIIGRDHASVIKYVRTFEDNIKFDKEYRETYNLIEREEKEQYSEITLDMMNMQIFQIESQLEILKQKQLLLIKKQ